MTDKLSVGSTLSGERAVSIEVTQRDAMRAGINLTGMSPAWTHLAEKYLRLLLLHDRYRRSWQTARYLPSINVALNAVRARMDTMQGERKAA